MKSGAVPDSCSEPINPTHIMIAPDNKTLLLSFDAKMPMLPTANYPDKCDDDMTTCWVMDANVVVFDLVNVQGISDIHPGGWLPAVRGFTFGSAGVSRIVSTGTRVYAINKDDGFLYCTDFSGATYPPLLLGSHLTGLTYGYDGKLYVADADSNMIYSIKLGHTPAHDKVEKGYWIPLPPEGNFRPGALVVAPPVK